jgi:hypothetical protein
VKPEFRPFLGRSLEVMAAQAPPAYAGLARALAGLPLRLEVDGRCSVLSFADGRHRLADEGEARALLRTDRATILDLVAGRISLLEALRGERLWLQGSPASLVRLDEALRLYLAGAVRAPAFGPLLQAFRHDDPRRRDEEE